jgi:hypothetical protein
LAKNFEDQTSFSRFFQFQSQACSLLSYLCGEEDGGGRREHFLHFLRDLRKKDRPGEVFSRHFDCGLDTLLNDWQRWARDREVGPHEPPPARVRAALVQRIIPLINDPDSPVPEVVLAVRDMGIAGYVLGADRLIRLVGDEDARLRDAAVWALESISGEPHGEDLGAWQAWWDRLPRQVEPASEEPGITAVEFSGNNDVWPCP